MGRLALKVFPGSKSPDIEFIEQGINSPRSHGANAPAFAVRLCEKAESNKANIALIKLMARLSGMPVQIASGSKSRIKTLEFEGDEKDFIQNVMQNWQKSK